MNSLKLTAVAAALMLAGSAYAANAQIYGLIDTGLNYQHIDTDAEGAHSVNKMQLRGSQLAPNRFGFRGSEDLGNGMKIAFLLEGQFGSDDGTLTGNRLFNRSSEISIISADYGTLTVGRSGALRSGFGSTGIWGAKTGPWSNSAGEFVAGHKYIMPGGFKAVDNAITYKTPTMSGLTLHAQYSAKMDNTKQKDQREFNHESNRLWALGATYSHGAFNAVAVLDGVMYSQTAGNRPDDGIAFSLEADYNFGFAKVYAAGMSFKDMKGGDFQGHEALGSLEKGIAYDGYSLELGSDIPLCGGTAKVNVGWMDAENADNGKNGTYRIALSGGYVYPLSKRTQLYSAAGWVQDKSNKENDCKPSAVEVLAGVLHRF